MQDFFDRPDRASTFRKNDIERPWSGACCHDDSMFAFLPGFRHSLGAFPHEHRHVAVKKKFERCAHIAPVGWGADDQGIGLLNLFAHPVRIIFRQAMQAVQNVMSSLHTSIHSVSCLLVIGSATALRSLATVPFFRGLPLRITIFIVNVFFQHCRCSRRLVLDFYE